MCNLCLAPPLPSPPTYTQPHPFFRAQLFGESFVHGGRPDSGPPAYVDPDVLLSASTVDRYIPFQ
jgi:hypothetical protein